MADFQPSSGMDRFYRLARLLIKGGTPIIRGLFDSIYPPSNFANVLQTNSHHLSHNLYPDEMSKLYGPDPTNPCYGKSEDFDLTLLFKLLRNRICNLTAPSTGWNVFPPVIDLSLEADITILKCHRNETFAHRTDQTIEFSEDDFNVCFEQIRRSLLRIVGEYSAPSTVTEWEEKIERCRTGPITKDDVKTYESAFPVKEKENVADGLAWSFYFGYLKFVLPELTKQINLTEQFRNKISVHKVFIIIPKNCYVFDKISNPQSDPKGLVESVGNLEPLKKNRGGIQDRTYHHTVHRIVDEITKDEYFCVMEYATPLMILHEMSNDTKVGLSREERDSQMNLFVRKLKTILDGDINCKGKYELVMLGRQDQDIGKIVISAMKNSAVEIGD